MKIPASALPIVLVPSQRSNPAWVKPAAIPDFTRGETWPANMHDNYYIPGPIVRAEVLTLNLNSGTMRVRYLDRELMPSDIRLDSDLPIAPFLEQFSILRK